MRLRLRSRLLAALLSVMLVVSTTGCASWWHELRTNPVAALQEGSRYIGTALTLAGEAFEAYVAAAGNVPPETVATFHRISGNVASGLQVANDGLRVAADATGNPPNANALLGDARTAMGDLATFLAGLQQPAGRAADPLMARAIDATRRASQPLAR